MYFITKKEKRETPKIAIIKTKGYSPKVKYIEIAVTRNAKNRNTPKLMSFFLSLLDLLSNSVFC